MISDVSYSSKILRLKSGKSVTFKYNIAEVAILEGIIIVRLDVPPGRIMNENIYGVSKDGNILWQISKLGHIYGDSPYTGMTRRGDKFTIYNWDGLDVTIDPYTGEILSKSYSK